MLWDELIKTFSYLKNQSSYIHDIISYELENDISYNFCHLNVVGSQPSVKIPKEKTFKLDMLFCMKSSLDTKVKIIIEFGIPVEKNYISSEMSLLTNSTYINKRLLTFGIMRRMIVQTLRMLNFANVNVIKSVNTDNSLYSIGENILKQSEKKWNDFRNLLQYWIFLHDIMRKFWDRSDKKLLKRVMAV